MREFIDSILSTIVAASLSDDEFATFTQDVQIYSEALYAEMLTVLDTRESVSGTRDRLRYVFLANGVPVEESSNGDSEIFIGSVLE